VKKARTLQGLRGAREDWHVLAKQSKALARKAARAVHQPSEVAHPLQFKNNYFAAM